MTDEKSCATTSCSSEKKCCPKKWILTSIATFAITLAFDWLVHGNLLMDTYEATASLWRSQEEMQTTMPLDFAVKALMAVVFAALFLRWKCTQTFGACFTSLCPVRKGFLFGAGIGLLMGLNAASAYIWQPIPQNLAIAWGMAELIKWGLVGAVLSLMCSRCSKA